MRSQLQSSRNPFYCAQCATLYFSLEKLVACLEQHERAEAWMRQVQMANSGEV